MAEDSEEMKHDGEVENPESEDAPAPAAAPTQEPAPAAVGGRSASPATPFPTLSISIWPPTQRTRDAVINRLIENLSTPSVLSKRYGTMPPQEASAIARTIEEEAFAVAAVSAPALSAVAGDEASSAEYSIDEGIETLHLYSKEISRRMIDSVKAKGSSASPAPAEGNDVLASGNGDQVSDSVPKSTIPPGEDIASGDSQPLAT